MKSSKNPRAKVETCLFIILFLSIPASFLEQADHALSLLPHTGIIVINHVSPVSNVSTHQSIQAAIDNAAEGDVITVSSGIYIEQIVINKSLSIKGENLETELVGDNQTNIIVTIEADNVTFSNFTIKNGQTGIYVINSTDCKIHNIEALTNTYGIFVKHSSNVQVSNNDVHDNQVYGIVFLECTSVTAEKNLVRNNEYGIHLHGCQGPNNVFENKVIESYGHGIFLDYTNATSIKRNTVLETTWYAVSLFSSPHNTVFENAVAHNGYGIYLKNSTNNDIYLNDFINNTRHLYDLPPSDNHWDHAEKGNYWDDYEGIDLNSDLIGDTLTPHLQIDYYPIINPLQPIPFHLEMEVFQISIIGNCTVFTPSFSYLTKQIAFNITGPVNTTASSTITIPKRMLQGEPWKVTMNHNNVDGFEMTENQTCTTIHVNSLLSGSQSIEITGTWVIPEFSAVLALYCLVMLSLAILIKHKQGCNHEGKHRR